MRLSIKVVQMFMKRLNNFRQYIVFTPTEEDNVSNVSDPQRDCLTIKNLSSIMNKKQQLPKPVEPLKAEGD